MAISVLKAGVHHRIPLRDIHRIVRLIAHHESNLPLGQLSVIMMGHKGMRDINRRFLHHDTDTDVIAFDLGDGSAIDGEIYIGTDAARRQAGQYRVTFSNEILRLVAHGLLHILGYDDATDTQKQTMLETGDRYIRLLKK